MEFQLGFGSYSYNTAGAGMPGITGPNLGFLQPLQPCSEAKVVAPAEMFAILDTAEIIPYNMATNVETSSGFTSIGKGWSGPDWAACALILNSINFQGTYSATTASGVQPIQHDNNRNALYCDGHAAAKRQVDLIDPRKTALNWNIDHKLHTEFWDDILAGQWHGLTGY
jgi:prepilin-type processing-associated H-X9-DG protein